MPQAICGICGIFTVTRDHGAAELRTPNPTLSMDSQNAHLPHPLPEKAFDLRMTVRRYGRGVAEFLERHLARKCGALIALLSCLALTAALVTQEYVCATIGRDGADLRTVDPMNATVSWLFVLANFGLSLVVIGTAVVALRRFPLAAFTGMGWVLASLGAGTVYNALATPVLSTWLCGALGVGGTVIDNVVVGDEVVRTCLVFLQDVTEMVGAAMLGAVLFRLERGARIVGICAFALAGWSLFDLMVSAVSTGPILHWSDVVSTILRALQCALSGAWFWRRSRADSGNQEGLSEFSELRPGQGEAAFVPPGQR
jgi:hypothetical protein